MKRRLPYLVLCAFMAAAMLAACGTKDDPDTDDPQTPVVDTGETESAVKMYVTDGGTTYYAGYDNLQDALDGAKKQIYSRGGVTVNILLGGGTYTIDETVSFYGGALSGKNYTLNIIGDGADNTVLTSLRSFDSDDADDLGLNWYAYSPSDSKDSDGKYPAYRELFCNGEAMTMAKSGEYNLLVEPQKYADESAGTLVSADDRVIYVEEDALINPSTNQRISSDDLAGAEIVIKDVWDVEILRIEGYTSTDRTQDGKKLYALRINDDDWTLLMNESGSGRNVSSGDELEGKCYYIQNCEGYLSEANSFVYDRAENRFVFILPDGVSIDGAALSYPVLDTLMYFEDVSNVNIYNIGFTGVSNLSVSDNGYITGQAGVQRTLASEAYGNFQPYAAIHGEDVSGFGVYGCSFEYVGVDGVSLSGAVEDVEIYGNTFYEIGGSAIRLADAFGNTSLMMYNENERFTDIVISYNAIENTGVYWLSSPAVQVGHVKNLEITHNTIRNASYTGISVGWSWRAATDETINVYNAEIAYNLIDGFMTSLQDGAAIYAMGGNASSSYTGYFNYMHDNYCIVWEQTGKVTGISDYKYSVLYLDASSTNWDVYSNVIYAGGLNRPSYGYLYLQNKTSQQVYNCRVKDNYIIQPADGSTIVAGSQTENNVMGLVSDNNEPVSSMSVFKDQYSGQVSIIDNAGCGEYTIKTAATVSAEYTALGDDSSIYVDETDYSTSGYVYHELVPTTSRTFNVTVSRTGIYEVAFKYTASTESFYGGVTNASVSYIKSFNHQSVSETSADGYNTTVYYVYLIAGQTNAINFATPSGVTLEISGLRLSFEKAVDAVANFNQEGTTNVGGGFMQAIRLVQVDSDQLTVETMLTITESGYYDLSYFGSAANAGELEVTLSGNGETIEMTSVGLSWETSRYRRDGKTDGTSHVCLFSDNLYVRDGDNPKNTLDNKYVYLEAGTYTVSATAPRVLSNSQVYIGGAIFATLVS